MKKRKKFNINDFSKIIKENKNSIPYNFSCFSKQLNTNSILNINEYEVLNSSELKNNFNFKIENSNSNNNLINSIKIKMILNNE
jgi:hypothetical protein